MNNFSINKREDLIFPEMTFTIVGLAFEVFNCFGSGQRELIYHNALQKQFELNKISFQSEVYHPVIFKGATIGKNYFDFLIDKKIVVELKRSDYFSKSHFEQVNHYLRISNYKLGLLISFTTNGVRFKRVLNI